MFDNQMSLSFPSKSVNEGLARTAVAAFVAVTAALLLFLFYTSAGKRLTSKVVASYLHGSVNYVSGTENSTGKNQDIGDLFESYGLKRD